MTSLLSIYSNRLGDLRDRMGVKRRLRGPVRQARELDQYLIGDGLDAATITADIHLLTKGVTWLRQHAPEYTEDLDFSLSDSHKKRQPRELVPFLYDWLSNQATRLAEDSATTTDNHRQPPATSEPQQSYDKPSLTQSYNAYFSFSQ